LATNSAAIPERPARRNLPLGAKIIIWAVRAAFVALTVCAIKFHWFAINTLKSRLFPAVILFIFFTIYWGASARNSAPAKSSESKRSTIFHQVVMNSAYVILFWPIPGLRGWFLSAHSPYLMPVGVAIEAAGIALAIWARRHLGRNWSAAVRIGEGHELVRSGPYRWLRHPIYTGVLFMVLGIAIVSAQYHALLALAILFVAYIRKTGLEEDILEKQFGAAYDDYRKHSWRLIPFIY
jgi:protein-S-isoprenylcysteine O-methyltransferase Ste14